MSYAGADLLLDGYSPCLQRSWPTGCSPAPWWLALWEARSLLIGASRTLRGELKDEMRAGENRRNKRIDEVKEEMKEFKLDGSAAMRVLQSIAVLARITR